MSLLANQVTKVISIWRAPTRGRFRLLRYFTFAALGSFLLVGIVLHVLQDKEVAFFAEVQRGQSRFFSEAQAELALETELSARRSLVAAQEAANVNLTYLFANALWEDHFAPLVARTGPLSPETCRALATAPTAPATAAADLRQRCFAELGLKIRALPGFAALDRQTVATMKNSNVFKIKVYDKRGLTIYSSDHRNIGEDKVDNAGWRSAAAGKAASELTHRDHFSTFEGMVENRDLLSSYIPVRRSGSQDVVGVFEVYADVTPMLAQIKHSTAQLTSIVAANQGRLEQTSKRNLETVAANSAQFQQILGGLLVLLFVTLLLIVRRGQSIIDQQNLAQEQNAARERLWHEEKMSAMATMAAHVSHETGNALTVISALAEELADPQQPGKDPADAVGQIREQSRRVFRMTRQINAFAAASNQPEFANINPLVEAVCYFFSFDRRFRSPIEFRPGDNLPWCDLVPDYLKEVLMNLLPTRSGHVIVETGPCSKGVRIRIRSEAGGEAPAQAANPLSANQLEIASRRVAAMGGNLVLTGTDGAVIEIELPACMREDSPH